MFKFNEDYNEKNKVFDDEYLFEKEIFKDEYEVDDKVYYLDNKKEYRIGTIREVEKDETGENLYLITGCLYLRSKEHIYSLYA